MCKDTGNMNSNFNTNTLPSSKSSGNLKSRNYVSILPLRRSEGEMGLWDDIY